MWIKLTRFRQGTEFAIKVDSIVLVEADEEGDTKVIVTDDEHWVRESVDDVVSMLNGDK